MEALVGLERGRALGPPPRPLCSARPFVDTLQSRARRESPDGTTLFRVPLGTRPDEPRAGSSWSTSAISPFQTDDGAAGGLDHRARGRHRSRESRGAAAAVREDGGDRSAGGRRRARGEHAAHRHLELHADAARTCRPGRSQDATAREDRAADVPRGQDRQQPAESRASVRRRDGSGRPERRRSTTCCRCSSTSSGPAAMQVRKDLYARARHRPRRRVQAAAGLPQSVPERPRRDAEGRLAVGDVGASTAPTPSSRWPTRASAFPPSTSRASTIRSSRRSRKAAARVWACRSRTASCRSMAAR